MNATDRRDRSRALSLAPTAALLLAFVPVGAHAAQTPYSGSPVQLPGTIQAEKYDHGGEGVAYHDTSAGNVFNVYRTDSMDVGAIPAGSGGGYHIGFLEPGEWAEYTVNVPVTQAYEVRLSVSSNYTGPTTFHLELDGTDVSGSRSVAYNGAWHDYQLLTIPAVTLTAGGSRVLRISFDTGHFNLDWLEIRGQAPFGASPTSLPAQRLQAENYDRGGEAIAYHDTTAGNVFGVYRIDEDMDVGAIPAGSGGGYHIGFLATGEWAEYTVNVTQTQHYEVAMRIASDNPLATRFRVLLDGQDISGLQSVTVTGGWHNYIEKVFPVGSVAAGSFRVLRLSFELGAFNLDWLELRPATPQCTAPAITQHPTGGNIEAYGRRTLSGAASGNPAPQYRWLKDGSPISGATQSSYIIDDAREDDIGSYRLEASNSCGVATSNAAQVQVVCNPGTPARLIESLAEAFNGRPAVCNWRAMYHAGFPNTLGDGSYNIAVAAAAVALVVDPNMAGPDPQHPGVAGWWRKYLRGELGERGNEWYFGGKEPFSAIYQNFNIAAVLGVHHQAHQAGLTDVRDLARRWLRATFALSAAAAAPDRALTLHDRGTVCVPFKDYNGPYLPMAGMRSNWLQWSLPDRAIYYASAVGIPNNGKGEKAGNAVLRAYLQSHWNGPGGSVYGLTPSEASALAGVRLTGQLPAGFSSMIAGIRIIKPYHIVAWPGVRVTLLEQNANGNTPPTYGVAFFSAPRDAAGNEAHFLYPWQRGTHPSKPCEGSTPGPAGFPAGQATLNLAGRFMTASQPGHENNPVETVTIDNLPAGPPQYHLTLGP